MCCWTNFVCTQTTNEFHMAPNSDSNTETRRLPLTLHCCRKQLKETRKNSLSFQIQFLQLANKNGSRLKTLTLSGLQNRVPFFAFKIISGSVAMKVSVSETEMRLLILWLCSFCLTSSVFATGKETSLRVELDDLGPVEGIITEKYASFQGIITDYLYIFFNEIRNLNQFKEFRMLRHRQASFDSKILWQRRPGPQA